MATSKTSSQIKGDKIKKAIANKDKTNFEKAFEKSPLSKSPTPGNTTSSNTGDGSGFKENLEYVAGVASRAAEKASSLRRQERGNDSYSIQNAQSSQTNVNRINSETQFNDRAMANNNAIYRESAARDDAKLNQFNANQRQDFRISQQQNQQRAANVQNENRYNDQLSQQKHQVALDNNQRAINSAQAEQERALRAAQSAAQMQAQRNNQLLSLARGGL